jgi:hypothetical protein
MHDGWMWLPEVPSIKLQRLNALPATKDVKHKELQAKKAPERCAPVGIVGEEFPQYQRDVHPILIATEKSKTNFTLTFHLSRFTTRGCFCGDGTGICVPPDQIMTREGYKGLEYN